MTNMDTERITELERAVARLERLVTRLEKEAENERRSRKDKQFEIRDGVVRPILGRVR